MMNSTVARQSTEPSKDRAPRYRTATIAGVEIFYRDAGPADAPVVLLPHGFPTSSHMFRELIPALSDRHRVIAPDLPGFGRSGMPDRSEFAYTFDNYANVMIGLMDHLGLERYALYCFDYGAPISYRVALKRPDRVTALIVQNGNAYEEGLQSFWDPMRDYWADRSAAHRKVLEFIVSPPAVKAQYTYGVKDVTRLDPDLWDRDQALLDRPGNKEIQLDIFLDYGTNLPLYPKFQTFFRERTPPTLIVWGQNDQIFPLDGAKAYLRDLPRAEFHALDTGHFVLEDKGEVAIPLIRDFLGRSLLHS